MKIEDRPNAIEEIIELRYTNGYSVQQIVLFLIENYDVSKSTAYQLIVDARQEIGEYHNKINEDVLGESIETLEHMRSRAIANEDGKLSLEVQKELNKIQQLHIQKLEIDGRLNIEIPLFPDEDTDD